MNTVKADIMDKILDKLADWKSTGVKIKNMDEINAYIEQTHKKSEFERVQMNKDKTGICIDGLKGINPITNKEIPIFVADYVMMGYGTGAIMAVPAHDTRDYEFAKKFGCDIIPVIEGGDIEKEAYTDTEVGTMINSGILNGLSVAEAKKTIIAHLRAMEDIGILNSSYKKILRGRPRKYYDLQNEVNIHITINRNNFDVQFTDDMLNTLQLPSGDEWSKLLDIEKRIDDGQLEAIDELRNQIRLYGNLLERAEYILERTMKNR